jgi:site-specific DNA recombinase
MQTKDAPPQNIVRCAIYSRVSSDQQAEIEFNSCDAQEERIRAFIASQEGFSASKGYVDPGYSGGSLVWPALQEMLGDIAEGRIDMVISAKIDRLTRSPKDFYQLMEYFEKYNVGFISVGERFDTSTPSGRLLRNIMLTFGQFERELTSERIRTKTLQMAQKGMYIGGHPPFGYKVAAGKLVLDPPRDEAVRVMFNTYAETGSVRQAHRALLQMGATSQKGGPVAEPTIWNALHKRIYTGTLTYQGKTYPGQHPAIISEGLYDHVQKIFKAGIRPIGKVPALPLVGLIRCQECGSTMTTCYTDKRNKSGTQRYYYYRCSKLTHGGWKNCSVRQIGAERLHDTLYQNLFRISKDTDYLKNLILAHQKRFQNPAVVGFEPDPLKGSLTPEIMEEMLKEFLNSCARRAGMDRILSLRRLIAGITYSQKTITVEFFYGRPADASDSDFARPPDGKSLSNQRPTSAAFHAAPAFRPPAQNKKGADRNVQSDPFRQFVSSQMVLLNSSRQKINIVFPNISHYYWEHFHLSGGSKIRRARAHQFSM